MLLDGDRIRELRRERNLAERDVGRAINRSPRVIRQIERGHGQEHQTLEVVSRLAALFEVRPTALFKEESTVVDESDATVVEAVLALIGRGVSAAAIARGLGWALPRVLKALDDLRLARQHSGMRCRHHAGKWSLVPALDLLPDAEVKAIERADVAQRGLTISQACVLYEVVEGRVNSRWVGYASIDQRNQLGRLSRLGYVRERAQGWTVSDDVRLGLGLG